MASFDAETADNLEDIERQFAVKAVQHVEAYWNLLSAIPGSKLKLTPHDNEIFETLLQDFPEFLNPEYVKNVNEAEMKGALGKERWRKFMAKFEGKVEDYNFGTIMRTKSDEEYTQDGTIFVLRLQFYAVEICRNRYGLNEWECAKK
ncbi:hypothetical protein BABINDRAFT_159375 [Babjeviella inositovora NRRL Y-12698]|uniref:Protein PBDC1 homolog n=1 Tax=Babjeviella inositovora NRRL Y-12698 TaxID=984486 RepID=A0A1E3QYY4_9ASCO|nr:uncharacterized protein BABINDRAFT_159375 [Babjeviella inositovora NRRL Y-12698]ODQ82880.1 hypothetical protein BABINDRAFT_159375 [Babjeviella inositovora NRRL Y-12698]